MNFWDAVFNQLKQTFNIEVIDFKESLKYGNKNAAVLACKKLLALLEDKSVFGSHVSFFKKIKAKQYRKEKIKYILNKLIKSGLIDKDVVDYEEAANCPAKVLSYIETDTSSL